jgi:hypothetical protein
VAVLEELRRTLPGAVAGPENFIRWLTVFVELFTDGTFGEQVAVEFPELAIEAAFTEINYQLGLLRVTASGGRSELPPALSDAAIQELENFRKFAGDIIRDAKKRGSKAPFRRGGKPGADQQEAKS